MKTHTHQLFNLNKYANIVNIPIHVVLKMKLCHCKHNVNKWNSHRTSLKWIEIVWPCSTNSSKWIRFWKTRQFTAFAFAIFDKPKPTATRSPMKTLMWWLENWTEVHVIMCTCIQCGMRGRLHLCDLSLLWTNELYRGTIDKVDLLQLSDRDHVRPIKQGAS